MPIPCETLQYQGRHPGVEQKGSWVLYANKDDLGIFFWLGLGSQLSDLYTTLE